MAAIDDILAFEWPENCNSQGSAMQEFLAYLNALYDEWQLLVAETLQLNQEQPPSIGDWQSAWLANGFALPIPDNTQLLWWSTSEATFGGEYTVVDGEIVRVENRYYRGRSDFIPYSSDAAQLEPNYLQFQYQAADRLLLKITTKVSSVLWIELPTVFSAAASVGTFAFKQGLLNYKLNGVLPFTGVLFSTSTLHPAASSDGTPAWFSFIHPNVLPPGTYDVSLTVDSVTSEVAMSLFPFNVLMPLTAAYTVMSDIKIPSYHFFEIIYEMST